jgi:hypothetical protein
VPEYSHADVPVLAFVVIPILLAGALVWGIVAASRRRGEAEAAPRRALTALAIAVIWMGATWAAGTSGVLRQWDATPPPFALLVLGIVALSVLIAWGPYGRLLATTLPLWILVGIQGFRLPLELAMHAMYDRGIMPVQMSYSGRNFDIVTGITALVVAAALRSGLAPRWLAGAWNVLGLALLLNIVTIAILSTPRFAFFGPDRLNVWVTYPPFIWLPAVMVLAALAGHLLIFRALREPPQRAR